MKKDLEGPQFKKKPSFLSSIKKSFNKKEEPTYRPLSNDTRTLEDEPTKELVITMSQEPQKVRRKTKKRNQVHPEEPEISRVEHLWNVARSIYETKASNFKWLQNPGFFMFFGFHFKEQNAEIRRNQETHFF